MRKIFTTILLMTAVAFGVAAQESTVSGVSSVAMPFSRIPRTATSLGMGGATNMESVAMIPFCQDKLTTSVSYLMWDGIYTTNAANLYAGVKLSEKLALTVEGSYDMGTKLPKFSPYDAMGGIGVSYAIGGFLSVGLTGRFLMSALDDKSTLTGFCGDALVGMNFSGLHAVLGVKEIGPKVSGYSLPTSATAGISYIVPFSDVHKVQPRLDVDYYFCGAMSLSIGAEYCWNDMISARGGYHMGGVFADFASLGLGVKVSGVSANVALLLGSSTIKSSLCFGLGYSF